ncbi:hypothetical protein [Streptomyces sp. NPDC047014]|uniref:hypothetical protein n=1 Tax=Streptomyces sp. NPDC047014 TaxID=3155736 RepID=UPI0033DA717C
MGGQQTSRTREPALEGADDLRTAADALADGSPVVHPFGTAYAVTALPDQPAVERLNHLKGRPPTRPGSVTTTRARIASLFDWSRLPARFPRRQVEELIQELLLLGPFGFRGPAAPHIPHHLTSVQDGVTTVRLLAPGHHCPSHTFLAEALTRTAGTYLAVASTAHPRHLTTPPGQSLRTLALPTPDAPAAGSLHPHHAPAPVPTTVLSFHHVTGTGRSGLPALTLERPGSLSTAHTRALAATHGFALTPHPTPTLTPRPHQD